jgi:hypothetical protein
MEFVFVRGFPRSGTHWVKNIINSHPSVSFTGEFSLHRMTDTAKDLMHCPGIRDSEPIFWKTYEQFCKTLLKRMTKPSEMIGHHSPTMLEDQPFPAKCVYILRDPRDVLVSRAFFIFSTARNTKWNNFPYEIMKKTAYSLKENLSLFEKNPEILLKDEKWVIDTLNEWRTRVDADMLFFKNHNSNPKNKPILFLTYEKLHSNFSEETAKLFTYLGLDFSHTVMSDFVQPGYSQEDIIRCIERE